MLNIIKITLLGTLVSFLGQLPLGNVNIAATQLAVQEGYKSAWKFGLGLALVEVVYLRIALTGINWVVKHQSIFIIMGWLSVALFLILGVASLWAAQKQSAEKKGLMIDNKINRFLLGISISAVNPVQIPFWFTWSLYLINSNWLKPTNFEYNFFTVGAGLGTLAGLAVYMYGGKWAITKMKTNNKALNRFMGIVFILVALLQWYRLIYSPWTSTLNK